MSRKAVQVGLAPNCPGWAIHRKGQRNGVSSLDSILVCRSFEGRRMGRLGGMNGGTMFYFGFDYFKLVIMRTVRLFAMAAVAGAAAWVFMLMAAMMT